MAKKRLKKAVADRTVRSQKPKNDHDTNVSSNSKVVVGGCKKIVKREVHERAKNPLETDEILMNRCDFMLSQTAAEAVIWNDAPSIGIQEGVSNIEDLVKKFTSDESNKCEDNPPSSPPLVSLWMDSPVHSTKETKKPYTRLRLARKGKRIDKKKVSHVDPKNILKKLTAVLKGNSGDNPSGSSSRSKLEVSNSLQCSRPSSSMCASTQKPEVPMKSSPLESTCLSPIIHHNSPHLTRIETSPKSNIVESTIVDTPKSAFKSMGGTIFKGTPKSFSMNKSGDDLWTDDELFEHDSFLVATQMSAANETPSPRFNIGKRRLATPTGGEKRRNTFKLETSPLAIDTIKTSSPVQEMTKEDLFKRPDPVSGNLLNGGVSNLPKQNNLYCGSNPDKKLPISRDSDISYNVINAKTAPTSKTSNSSVIVPVTKNSSLAKQNTNLSKVVSVSKCDDVHIPQKISISKSQVPAVAIKNSSTVVQSSCKKLTLNKITNEAHPSVPASKSDNMKPLQATGLVPIEQVKLSKETHPNTSHKRPQYTKDMGMVKEVDKRNNVINNKLSTDWKQKNLKQDFNASALVPTKTVHTSNSTVSVNRSVAGDKAVCTDFLPTDGDLNMSISEDILAALAEPDDLLDSQACIFDESMTETETASIDLPVVQTSINLNNCNDKSTENKPAISTNNVNNVTTRNSFKLGPVIKSPVINSSTTSLKPVTKLGCKNSTVGNSAINSKSITSELHAKKQSKLGTSNTYIFKGRPQFYKPISQTTNTLINSSLCNSGSKTNLSTVKTSAQRNTCLNNIQELSNADINPNGMKISLPTKTATNTINRSNVSQQLSAIPNNAALQTKSFNSMCNNSQMSIVSGIQPIATSTQRTDFKVKDNTLNGSPPTIRKKPVKVSPILPYSEPNNKNVDSINKPIVHGDTGIGNFTSDGSSSSSGASKASTLILNAEVKLEDDGEDGELGEDDLLALLEQTESQALENLQQMSNQYQQNKISSPTNLHVSSNVNTRNNVSGSQIRQQSSLSVNCLQNVPTKTNTAVSSGNAPVIQTKSSNHRNENVQCTVKSKVEQQQNISSIPSKAYHGISGKMDACKTKQYSNNVSNMSSFQPKSTLMHQSSSQKSDVPSPAQNFVQQHENTTKTLLKSKISPCNNNVNSSFKNSRTTKSTKGFQKFPSYDSLNIHDSPKTPIKGGISSSQESKKTSTQLYTATEIERKRLEALKRRQMKQKL